MDADIEPLPTRDAQRAYAYASITAQSGCCCSNAPTGTEYVSPAGTQALFAAYGVDRWTTSSAKNSCSAVSVAEGYRHA